VKNALTVIVVLLLVGVPLLVADVLSIKRLSPEGRTTTLREFLAWQPEASRFCSITIGDKQHVIAFGPKHALFASGYPAYVFDETGNLIDWSTDIGDDPEFDERWKGQSNNGELNLTRQQVLELPQAM
jgi:hypothetical protein